jgi:hypothetical protein
MKSITAEILRPAFEPVALLWSDTKPDGALQISPHARTCIMPCFVQVVTKGETAVFDRETCGCPGARTGLGLGNDFIDALGGAGAGSLFEFFVNGAASSSDPDAYCAAVLQVRKEKVRTTLGERSHSSGEETGQFMTWELPITDITERYVIVTPLSRVKPDERPVVVIFVASPLQIAGLVTLVGSIREGTDPVRVPPRPACQQIGAFVYDEAKKEHPRAVLGYTDLATQANVGMALPEHMFTFAVPFSLFTEMEEKAEDGVFDGPIWRGLVGEV